MTHSEPVETPGTSSLALAHATRKIGTGTGTNTGTASLEDLKVVWHDRSNARGPVGFRVRAVEQAPDGALWLIEDDDEGGLYRLTPK